MTNTDFSPEFSPVSSPGSPNRRRSCSGRREGALSIELALVAPVFFLIVFAAVEFMRAAMIEHSTINAAYEGARRGMVPGASADDARNEALGVMNTIGVTGAAVTITPATLTPQTQQVTVTVDTPLDENGWVAPLFFQGMVASSSCTLRREGWMP